MSGKILKNMGKLSGGTAVQLGFDPNCGCLVILTWPANQVVGTVPREMSLTLAKNVQEWEAPIGTMLANRRLT